MALHDNRRIRNILDRIDLEDSKVSPKLKHIDEPISSFYESDNPLKPKPKEIYFLNNLMNLKDDYPISFHFYKKISISDLPFSPRAKVVLDKNKVKTLGGLLKHSGNKIYSFKGLGGKTIKEIFCKLKRFLKSKQEKLELQKIDPKDYLELLKQYSQLLGQEKKKNNRLIIQLQNQKLATETKLNAQRNDRFIIKILLGDKVLFKDKRRYKIFVARYGFFRKKRLTLQRLGNCHNLTRERIRQLNLSTIERLNKFGLNAVRNNIVRKIELSLRVELRKNNSTILLDKLFYEVFRDYYIRVNKENFLDFFILNSPQITKWIDKQNNKIYYKIVQGDSET